MSAEHPEEGQRSSGSPWIPWAAGLIPLALLLLLVAGLIQVDPLAPLRQGVPPLEDLTVERVVLLENPPAMIVMVVNGGAEPVTIAQVLVDDAYWAHEIGPRRTLHPLASATIEVPYPWVRGEPHELTLVTSTGLTFTHTIEVATVTPTMDLDTIVALGSVGIVVGVVPVAIGLCWYVLVRRIRQRIVHFFLAVTAGVLIFLAFDATVEAMDIAPRVPAAFRGLAMFFAAAVGAFTLLLIIGALLRQRGAALTGPSLAALIAVGIGLHNLGEGLAIGAAYALGQAAFTTLLVIGFATHNVSEGLAIVAPLWQHRTRIRRLVILGALAGAPVIPGTWIGASFYSPALAILFLGLGVGAILQVLWELSALSRARSGSRLAVDLSGITAGFVLMYLTSVIIAV